LKSKKERGRRTKEQEIMKKKQRMQEWVEKKRYRYKNTTRISGKI
jgi:hypothetical protein